MRIKKFRIQNYKSILDSGEVTLDPRITTLLGKNESGKTNVLKALESFKRKYEYEKGDLCLHSPLTTRLDSGEAEAGAVDIATVWFEVEEEDRSKLKEIDPRLPKMKSLICWKHFDNSYTFDSPEVDFAIFDAEPTVKVDTYLYELAEASESFGKKLDAHSKRHPPFAGSKAQYDGIIDEITSFDPKRQPNLDDVFGDFYTRLRGLPGQDQPIGKDIEGYITEIDSHKNAILEALPTQDVTDRIVQLLPNFMYYTEVEKIEDTVPIADFLADRESHKTLSNLLRLSDLDIEDVKDARTYHMLSEFRAASKTITGLVNDSWTKGTVEIRITIVRKEIVTSIHDDVIKREHPPSIRSRGFQWYLSFYINFTAASEGELENTVILLDDPGVYLHPSWQKSLLDTLENISESNQIVLSTHSPFMVDREKLERIRLISKSEEEGTLLEEKYYKSDFDALQPIRAAIGMTIGDSLIIGKKNLLVEGVSDEIILRAMSELCRKKGKDCIDTSRISILPVIGADKMPYFTILFTKENFRFLALLDSDTQGRRAVKNMVERFNIDEMNILALDKLSEKGKDVEIEDLVDIDFYLEAVSLAYEEDLAEKLLKKRVDKNDLPDASFKGVKKFFRETKIQPNGKIDKIRVAKKIQELVTADGTPSAQTMSIFSKLFKMINERLGES